MRIDVASVCPYLQREGKAGPVAELILDGTSGGCGVHCSVGGMTVQIEPKNRFRKIEEEDAVVWVECDGCEDQKGGFNKRYPNERV